MRLGKEKEKRSEREKRNKKIYIGTLFFLFFDSLQRWRLVPRQQWGVISCIICLHRRRHRRPITTILEIRVNYDDSIRSNVSRHGVFSSDPSSNAGVNHRSARRVNRSMSRAHLSNPFQLNRFVLRSIPKPIDALRSFSSSQIFPVHPCHLPRRLR